MFCECGAWSNFSELEDSLTLEELLELYDMSSERQSRQIKVMAAAMGAEIPDDAPPERNNVRDASDLGDLPFNLGYEKIS